MIFLAAWDRIQRFLDCNLWTIFTAGSKVTVCSINILDSFGLASLLKLWKFSDGVIVAIETDNLVLTSPYSQYPWHQCNLWIFTYHLSRLEPFIPHVTPPKDVDTTSTTCAYQSQVSLLALRLHFQHKCGSSGIFKYFTGRSWTFDGEYACFDIGHLSKQVEWLCWSNARYWVVWGGKKKLDEVENCPKSMSFFFYSWASFNPLTSFWKLQGTKVTFFLLPFLWHNLSI